MLDRMTMGAAQELYDFNIAVNALAPSSLVATPHAYALITNVNPATTEPMETFVEASLALCTGDPKVLTSRVTNSFTLLKELNRPVYTLDSKSLVEGWQPDQIDPAKIRPPYLAVHGH